MRPEFHEKELAIVGSGDGWDYREHASWYFDVVRGTDAGLEELFDSRIHARELPRAFEDLATGRVRAVKVLVDYRRDPP